MARVHSGEEILSKCSASWVGCTNVTDRQTTDGLAIAKTQMSHSHVQVKIGGNLTKFWQKQFCTVFWRHSVQC